MFISLSLLLTTAGQLLQKKAAHIVEASEEESSFVLKLLSHKETYWAGACLAGGAGAWLIVLYYMEVSKAMPFLSLGFVLVALVSKWVFKETVSKERWLGVIFIVIGIALVAAS